MPRRVLLPLLTTVAVLLALPALASASTKHASAHLGIVRATVTWTQSGNEPIGSNAKVTIVRGGKTAYQAKVNAPACGTSCDPFGPPPIQVLNLDGNGEPVVLLYLYSGGAHCCSIIEAYRYVPATGTYKVFARNFGDPGALVKRLGTTGYQFVSADDSFAYLYTSFAASGLPLQILHLGPRGFVDVTSAYPALVTADAGSWWKTYRQVLSGSDTSIETEGLFAAWAADEYRLGKQATVASTLKHELAAHHISGQVKPANFTRALTTFLKQHGY